MTTEKDAMALAAIQAVADWDSTLCRAPLLEAKAHLASRISELEAEVAAANQPRITELHFINGQLSVEFAVDFAKDIARCFSDLCDSHGAQNYLELKFSDGAEKEFIVTVQKGGRESPADQKKAAEARATRAEAELARVREALEVIAGLSMSQFHKPQDLGNAAIKLAATTLAPKDSSHE